MKSLFQLTLLTGVAGLALMGCEKHDFDATKVLHESHGGHYGESHHDDHKEDQSGHGDEKNGHDKKGHGEKNEEHQDGKKESGEGRDVGL